MGGPLTAEVGLPADVVEHRSGQPVDEGAEHVGRAIARVPLRQIGGADLVEGGERPLDLVVDDRLPAGDREWPFLEDDRVRMQTVRDVGDGEARSARANHANDADSSSSPGVSDNHTAAP